MFRHPIARAVVYTHRWLGIAGGALFVMWFATGIVMMYARMPVLTEAERLARMPALDVSSLRVAPASIMPGDGVTRVTVGMFDARPVYRILAGRRWHTVFADTGEALGGLTRDQAMAVAARFAPEHLATWRYDARLTDADQWAFAVRGLMPMHRIALNDGDGTEVYVSDQTGEVVLKTTAHARRWAYLGAVLHWIYFTPFRRQSALWSETIIWLSVAGTVLALTGLAWGLWRLAPFRRYRFRGQKHWSPYAGWMRWHHYAGLLFGVTTVTWIFSGLLSMDPWSWSPSTTPTREQREAVTGGPLDLSEVTPDRLVAALAVFGAPAPREVELVQFRSQRYVRAAHGAVSLSSPDRGVLTSFDRDALLESAKQAMPGITIEDAVWLNEHDAYYYSRDRRLPLPILRVRYSDPPRTWLYLDPSRGIVARKEERLSRLNRWLYHGFHSLDFPFLYRQRPLWDIVVIVFSLGGIVLSATTMTAAWRRVRRHIRPGRFRARGV